VPAWLTPLRETVSKWSEHKDARLGAALAYYSVFSLGPLILIAIAIAGLFFGAEAVQGQVLGTLKGMLGDAGTQAIEAMLKGADRPREGMVATVIGIGTLIFAAIGVVVQLKDALNTVWEVETTPGSGVWRFVRSYILSLAGVLALGFLLLTSMLLTAALFEVGKFLIGLYIGKQGPRIDLRRRSLDHRRADLGLLLRPARSDGRRIHQRLRAPLRLAQACRFRRGSIVASESGACDGRAPGVMGRAKLVSLRVRHERKIEKEGAGCRPGTHNAGARDLARRVELAVGSMAIGAVRHPESIVLERIESAGAGSPRYAAVQRGRLRSARVGRRLLHFVALLRLGARIRRHAGHRRYDRGGNGGSNSFVEHSATSIRACAPTFASKCTQS